jgi:GGDEF domain-containing protein
MAAVLWSRYAYLIELHEVMSYGPSYDPITRMRTHSESGQTVAELLAGIREEHAPVGIVVVSIANFYALDKLHGQAAVNHAMFVCAGRLRRSLPKTVEMGRLGLDGFVFIMRQCGDSGRLIDLARLILLRLGKPLSLNTSGDISRLETENTVWAAELGLGVLRMTNPAVRSASAIALARGLSRAAVSYVSRIAWFDHSSGEMAELPELRPD